MKKIIFKILSTLASFAFAVSVFSGGTAFVRALHQEKEPEVLSEFLG
jgi:cyclic lactone autoinducer peptide